MKKFNVCITTTFNQWYEVEATSKKDALKQVQDEINSGECAEDYTDTDDFETEITAINEVK